VKHEVYQGVAEEGWALGPWGMGVCEAWAASIHRHKAESRERRLSEFCALFYGMAFSVCILLHGMVFIFRKYCMCCMVYTVWGLLYSMVWSAGFYCILCIVVCIILYCMLSIVWYVIVWYNVTLHFVLHFMYFMCHNVFYVFSLMYCTVRH